MYDEYMQDDYSGKAYFKGKEVPSRNNAEFNSDNFNIPEERSRQSTYPLILGEGNPIHLALRSPTSFQLYDKGRKVKLTNLIKENYPELIYHDPFQPDKYYWLWPEKMIQEDKIIHIPFKSAVISMTYRFLGDRFLYVITTERGITGPKWSGYIGYHSEFHDETEHIATLKSMGGLK